MNLGIYVKTLSNENEMSFISNIINAAVDNNNIKDCSIFYDGVGFIPFDIPCGMFNSTDLWNFNGKLLVFNYTGDKFSMHYHLKKKESWYVQQGSFIFSWLDVEDGKLISQIIKVGDSVTIERGLPHQLQAIDDNSTIYEVSTQHFNEDSYRIFRNTPMDLIGK